MIYFGFYFNVKDAIPASQVGTPSSSRWYAPPQSERRRPQEPRADDLDPPRVKQSLRPPGGKQSLIHLQCCLVYGPENMRQTRYRRALLAGDRVPVFASISSNNF